MEGKGTINEMVQKLLEATEFEISELQAEYDRIDAEYKKISSERDGLSDVLRRLKYLRADASSFLEGYEH